MPKKLFSLLLILVLAFALQSPAFAAKKEHCAGTPLLVVQGFGSVPLMDGEKEIFLPSDPGMIAKGVVRLGYGLGVGIPMAAARRSAEPVAKGLIPFAKTFFDPLKLDASQKPIGPALVSKQFPGNISNHGGDAHGLVLGVGDYAAKQYGEDHVYLYTFDWRQDVFSLAEEMNNIVRRAKQETGHSRVNIVALSMGAAVTNAYLADYGSGDLGNIVYLSPGWQGVSTMDSLLTGDLTLDFDNLKQQVLAQQGDKTYVPGWLMDLLLLPLKQIGAAEFFEKMSVPLMEGYLRDVVRYWPGIWTLCPYGKYEKAREICFPGGGTKEEQAMLRKLDRYHKIQGEMPKTVERLQKNGHGFAVVSLYSAPLYGPVSFKEHTLWADGVIDTYYSGGFPTLAEMPGDKKLAAQKIKDGHNHLSPDGVVDASTCLLPENTWFIRGLQHAAYLSGEWPSKLAFWLVEGGSRGTVHSDKNYPQFSKYAKGSETPGAF